jgi:hypothetical protein
VTLHPANRLRLHRRYALSINGSISTGRQDVSKRPLVGDRSVTPGGDYKTVITGKQLVHPSGILTTSRLRPHV